MEKDFSDQIDRLDQLLFGPTKKKQRTKIKFSLTHMKNILLIISKIDVHLLNNLIKANIEIGPKNVIKLLFMQIRIIDEMERVNEIHKERGG
jgi:hypothetical protein